MRSRGICLLLLACVCMRADAALIITDADITAGHYVYDLVYAEMASDTVFDNDVWTQSHVDVYAEPSSWGGARYVRAEAGYSTASFTCLFDFSTTAYRAAHMDLRDYVALFNNEDPNEDTVVTTAWSLDGSHYNVIQVLETPERPTVGAGQVGTAVLSLAGLPATVYYQVTMVNSDPSGFSLVQNQWNRQGPPSGDDRHFRVDFTMARVPEPASLALLACGMWCALRRRRSRHAAGVSLR